MSARRMAAAPACMALPCAAVVVGSSVMLLATGVAPTLTVSPASNVPVTLHTATVVASM